MNGLAEACRALLQAGVLLLLAATPLLGVGLLVAARLRRSGDPAAAVTALRVSLVCLFACAPLLLLPPLSLRAARRPQTAPPPSVPAPDPRPAPLTRPVVVLPAPPPSPAPPPPRPRDYSAAYVAAASLWGGVSLTLLLGLLGSHAYLLHLRRTATPLPADSDAVRALRGAPSAPLLLAHPRVTIPFAAEAPFLRPAIFLPADGGASWAAEALPAVLAHEAAHLRRGDFGWNLLARLAWAVLWPHPLVWLLLRRLEEAQELACDADALAAAGTACRPRAYADCLVNMAERHGTAPAWARRAAGTAAVSRRSLLEERIRNIMKGDEVKGDEVKAYSLTGRARVGLAGGVAVTVGLLLAGLRVLAPAAALPPTPAADAGGGGGRAGTEPDGLPDRTVSLDLRNVLLDEALEKLFAGTGMTPLLSPELRAAVEHQRALRPPVDPLPGGGYYVLPGRITYKSSEVQFRSALGQVLAGWSRSPRPRWRVEGSVVQFYVPSAQSESAGPLAERISVDFRGRDIRDALRVVLAGSGLEVYFAPELRESLSGLVTLKTSSQSRAETIRLVLRGSSQPQSGKVRWSLEGDTVRFLPTDLGPDGLPRKTVTLNYPERTSLRTVLDELFADTGAGYGLSHVSPDVTTRVRVDGVPFRTALEAVLRRTSPQLSYRVTAPGGVSIFDAAEKARVEGAAAERRAALDAEEDEAVRRGEVRGAIIGGPLPQKKVSVDVKDALLREALQQVFNAARVDFSIDNAVQGVVTARFENEPLDVVLPALLRQSPTPLLCRFENNVLIIRRPRR